MFPVFEASQVRSDNTSDGTLVGRAIGMASNVFENGANVEAGAAANATQCITLFWISEQPSSMIVEKHNVHFDRAVRFVFLARTSQLRVVARQMLSSPSGREHGEQQCQVFESGDDFFDSHQ